ncbi:hypothetical protein [Fodinibius sediminis]|uniref:Cytochrome C n=1 Tax=Fodinibius sediminis TaxID=1214077 RepID=A0A521CK52_9BACT|nr:hypothetical protein [Fodinibius sediminis]SMO59818.1 hypothetical protein SAMN06265218_106150 [Fodinibius sediminis]
MNIFGNGTARIFSILGLFIASALIIQCNSQPGEEPVSEQPQQAAQKAKQDTPELADAMGQLQYYTHKYALALDARNHELATFYFHEVRAAADGIIENIPGYEGYDIARFMNLFLSPTLEPVETALASRNWEEARQRTIEMVDACNSCHNATSHGFVKVTPGFSDNPYNQDFSAPE